MRIRLTSVVLILMLGSSAFAGVPMQSGEQSCSMDHGMAGMDCCKTALMTNEDARVATARICCALNCLKEGTAPNSRTRLAPQLQLTLISYPVIPVDLVVSHTRSRVYDCSHGPPGNTDPAYIRNLALLI